MVDRQQSQSGKQEVSVCCTWKVETLILSSEVYEVWIVNMTRACRWCGRRFRDGGGGARLFWCETLTNFDWPDRAGGSNGSFVLEVDESTRVQDILSRAFV